MASICLTVEQWQEIVDEIDDFAAEDLTDKIKDAIDGEDDETEKIVPLSDVERSYVEGVCEDLDITIKEK